MYGLPDDLRKIEKCWRRHVSIVKLHIDIEHLVGYIKTVYPIMHGINNNIKLYYLSHEIRWTFAFI